MILILGINNYSYSQELKPGSIAYECIKKTYNAKKSEVTSTYALLKATGEWVGDKMIKLAPDSYYECALAIFCPPAYILTELYEEEEEFQILVNALIKFTNDKAYRDNTIKNATIVFNKLAAKTKKNAAKIKKLPENFKKLIEFVKDPKVNIDVNQIAAYICSVSLDYGIDTLIAIIISGATSGAATPALLPRLAKNMLKIEKLAKKLDADVNFITKNKKFKGVVKCVL